MKILYMMRVKKITFLNSCYQNLHVDMISEADVQQFKFLQNRHTGNFWSASLKNYFLYTLLSPYVETQTTNEL